MLLNTIKVSGASSVHGLIVDIIMASNCRCVDLLTPKTLLSVADL